MDFKISFKELAKTDSFKFQCEEDDLNDFFNNDAVPHSELLLAKTYVYYKEGTDQAIAFFTVSNDAIKSEDVKSFKRKLSSAKRYPFFPAVKIGRLGRDINFKGLSFGQKILDDIKHSFTFNNKTGCCFITVDAYNNPKILDFYKENGFRFFIEEESEDRKTRAMYYNLQIYKKNFELAMRNYKIGNT